MRFIFSAPFRTNINLKTVNAVDSSDLIYDVLYQAKQDIEGNVPETLSWDIPWNKSNNGELQYAALTEDSLPLSATPILKLNISNYQCANALIANFAFESLTINSCFVEYYDNTIAILTIDMVFNGIKNTKLFLENVDKWSTAYCSSVIKYIKPFETSMLFAIAKYDGLNKKQIFLKAGNFTVFFDRNSLENNAYIDREEMLWVTRLLLQEQTHIDIELLKTWTQQAELDSMKQQIGSACVAFCTGNSVVFNTMDNAEDRALKVSLSISMYFYVLYDLLNKNLRLMFLNISRTKKVPTFIITNVNQTRSHIEFIENEFSDVLMGLQGVRSRFCKILLDTWNYPDLVGAVQKKKESVGKTVAFILEEKSSRYRRIIESILATVGGIAILDFSLSLFTFASNAKISKDSIPGLIDSTKYLSVDGTLYTIVLFLCLVFFFIIKKR